jgi:diguanylate cyclase (GGDEF)-like protein
MLVFVAALVPHATWTFGGAGTLDGLTLPLTLLYANSALIAALYGFSQALSLLRDQRVAVGRLHDLAHRDALTGLHNRRALEADLRQVGTDGLPAALLVVLDVNGLKQVNDARGHASGDDLLRHLGDELARQVSEPSRAYRIGGDEFALLLQDAASPLPGLVQRISGRVHQQYPESGVSLGAAAWQPGEAPEAWLARADQEMYRHKRT